MEVDNLEDISEVKQTWNKIETISRKTGLREGISDGRESNFQEYFDSGFREGLKNGFVLGKYKGLLAAHTKQNNLETVKYPLLEKTSRGGCLVCENEELLEDDVPSIMEKQTDGSNKNLRELYATFNKTFSCELAQSLEEI